MVHGAHPRLATYSFVFLKSYFFSSVQIKKKMECNDPGHVMMSVGGQPVASESFAKIRELHLSYPCGLFFQRLHDTNTTRHRFNISIESYLLCYIE